MKRERERIDIDARSEKREYVRAEEEKQHLLAKAKGVQNELCHHLEHLAERREKKGRVARW